MSFVSVAVNKIPNFLANPNSSENAVMPHHRCTIHLNCEHSSLIHDAYLAAQAGSYAKRWVQFHYYMLKSDYFPFGGYTISPTKFWRKKA